MSQKANESKEADYDDGNEYKDQLQERKILIYLFPLLANVNTSTSTK
jgi:hypothetical protein